jgi:DNA helicase-2/ATP-dependent DNA helicase PcrA
MRKLYLSYARRRALFGASSHGVPSRFLGEIPGELLDERGGGGGFGLGGILPGGDEQAVWSRSPAADAPRARREPVVPAASFRLGEDVVHAAFGDGVVTGVEPDGVIVVRFAGDGSERKLMAEYAPVTRR